MTNCVIFQKKKTPNSIRIGVHSLNDILGYFSPLLDGLTKQPHYNVSSGSSKHITAPHNLDEV